jgi:hypothetical protein
VNLPHNAGATTNSCQQKGECILLRRPSGFHVRIREQKTNVLILEIDGVLNSRITARKHGSYCIDPILAERFHALVEATSGTVVLSSTHRLYEETRCGVLAAGILFDGCTPDLPTQTRAAEITAWWQKHPRFKFRISTL